MVLKMFPCQHFKVESITEHESFLGIWTGNLFSAVSAFLYEVGSSGGRKYPTKPGVYIWERYPYVQLKKYWSDILKHNNTNQKWPVHLHVRSLLHSVWLLTQAIVVCFCTTYSWIECSFQPTGKKVWEWHTFRTS